ncbi:MULTISPECIES: BLUF domain-containing protein [Acinetobacter]|jgi:Sensors of blue-light using FAD|uniref:BLUF domain-containing protein n=1 Tax=Acinetobacter TaxID=469 RepID=UPI00029DF052|nr:MULTISPECIES: BLUF domain-containing protein [Acinetobacter]EKU51412.1 sensors of blue-light using FAD [Acinetobacter sp. WC-323]
MESVRLLYVSKIKNIDSNLKTTLIEILDEAVDFNYRHNITGVLYYGHGYFVQCLEGTKTAIDDLFYNSIVKDERHVNCEILYYVECEDKFFSQWSMKFSPINQNITDFFMKYHLEEFNPYLLTAETVEKFVAVLAGEPEYDVQAYVS